MYVIIQRRPDEIWYYDAAVGTFYPRYPNFPAFEPTIFANKDDANALCRHLQQATAPCDIADTEEPGIFIAPL